MRWSGQAIGAETASALPGLGTMRGLVRSVQTPEFAGITFHEVLAKSALNQVPGSSNALPFAWTINPYRGCSHACVFCFARQTHTYLDFDAGRDFDAEIVVKVNVAEILAKELARPSWQHAPVALGTNTDPYQRAEGRYRLMPGIIAALAASGTPFSILTKGTLLRRDIPLLQAAAERVPIELAMTIDIADPVLRESIESGAPTTEARLATVRAGRAVRRDRRDGGGVGRLLRPAPQARRPRVVLHLAGTRASRAAAQVRAALPDAAGLPAEGVPRVARETRAAPAAEARTRASAAHRPDDGIPDAPRHRTHPSPRLGRRSDAGQRTARLRGGGIAADTVLNGTQPEFETIGVHPT
jgi:hypothetical protein